MWYIITIFSFFSNLLSISFSIMSGNSILSIEQSIKLLVSLISFSTFILLIIVAIQRRKFMTYSTPK